MKSYLIVALLVAIVACVGYYVALEPAEAVTPVKSVPMTQENIIATGKMVAVNITTATDTTLVAAVTDRKIYAWPIVLKAEGATDVTLKSDTTSISGPIEFADGDSFSLTLESAPFVTAAGEALILTTSGSVTLTGSFFYVTR